MAAPGQKCDFWKVLGLARNPSKKMRLDESFRMVRVPCHLDVVVKSYGQITVWENVMGKWGRNVMDYTFGGIHWTPSKAVVIFIDIRNNQGTSLSGCQVDQSDSMH